jgi:hypothetical protein
LVSFPVSVTVATGQRVHVTSHAALGSTAAGGANALNLYICYRLSGGLITTVGGGAFGMTAAQNQRHLYGLSAVITGLPAGTYDVGLCGSSSSTNWNFNEWAYTSAMVFNQ